MTTGKHKKYAAGQAEKDSERKVAEPFSTKERRNVKAKIHKHRDVREIGVNKMAGTEIGAMAAVTALSGSAMRT